MDQEQMHRYAGFTLRDFIQDDRFIQWVKYPDAQGMQYWDAVRKAYPHQSSVMDHAANLIHALAAFHTDVPEAEIEKARQAIFDNIEEEKPAPVSRRLIYFSIAASVLILLGIAVWFRPQVTVMPIAKKAINGSQGQTERVNNGLQAEVIALSEGSTITLAPHSRVKYTLESDDRREVYLQGEAVFNVTKNAEKPFYVYANGLVTKVLGTQFKILAYPDDDVKVEVSSGRVRVYSSETGREHAETEGLTLTPNQKAVYTKKDQLLTRMVVAQPKVLITAEQLKTYTYTDTPISKIFEGLEDIYGIKVIYDKETFKNCRLNMSLSDESLFEKLELIGKVVDARYNVIDGQVIFIGQGCTE
ncbi:FecR family protein [Dyadobacter sp. CY347]|uniref:FecR family protein n=1 Tax=Dyadobacter sp. CY347 TaxID=2909336 RepID=UPI001F2B2825|nr:FecR family protein [Dyadobacter sp. CY347]MCF2489380.1 FecR domain-containing protein [Dyadobacter sp. CY347]